jgi:hypothetical protein
VEEAARSMGGDVISSELMRCPVPLSSSTLQEKRRWLLWRSTWSPPRRSTPKHRARGRVQEAAVRALRCLHASPLGETSGGARLDAPIPSTAGALRVGLAVDVKASVVAGLHLAPFPLSRCQKP